MKTEFTPGPWSVGLGGDTRAPWVRHRTPSGFRKVDLKDRANVHLTAAAPDLYEALEMVRDADEDCKKDGWPTIPAAARAKIDAALAKATGSAA